MKKHNILVTGGGGFIGTQVAWELADNGHNITIVDRKAPVHKFPGIYRVDDYLNFLENSEEEFDTVVHLAADHIVEQSVLEPQKYYANNVVKMKAMLDVMVGRKIKNIVFSSSGSVYGRQGGTNTLVENLYYDPENPYASTKVAGELLIKDYARAYGMKYVTFRYFNAAGADPQGRFGYVQRPATHVVPIMCNKILNDEAFTVYGSDYPTRDGTCIRDYIHVADLAKAHTKAIELMDNNPANQTFNLGGGTGTSLKELLRCAGMVVGKDPVVVYGGRREGDPAMLVADISKASLILNWTPQYTIQDMIEHAWTWEQTVGTHFDI